MRTEGLIAAAEPLLATLAEYRQQHALLTAVDAVHPWVARLGLPTELDIDQVVALEEALKAELSDALLATLACQVPHLEDTYEMTLRDVGAHSEAAWSRGCPRDLVAFARAQEAWYCVPRRLRAWAATPVTRWTPAGAEAPRGLEAWIRQGPMDDLWDMLCELELVDVAGEEPLPAHAQADAAPPLVPRLTRPAAARATRTRRVQHAKFGVGIVLQEHGDGDARKLSVDFGAHGVRTILARFVQETAE